jgi:hemin uptake protein HemP
MHKEPDMTPCNPQHASAKVSPASSAQAPAAPQLLDSQTLLRGQNAVAIAHNGALYRLQTTRQGKLILTK